jgi:hypothetical protein
MVRKIISNPIIHISAVAPDEVGVLDAALDEFAALKKLAEFETALAIALTGLFDIAAIFGIAGIILFIF